MTSKVCASLACLLALAALAFSSDGGLILPTANGLVRLSADEVALYQAVDGYLGDRLAEVERVRPGMTFEEFSLFFHRDGGLVSPPPHRFVHVLCPFIKLDVEFEGEDVGGPYRRFPPDARIARVSKPYLEQPYTD
ncbi:MAG: hypothetical protein ACE5EG_12010 [Thermoanaerobaculia bacterium]